MGENAPCKLLIEDIRNCRKTEDSDFWSLRLNAGDNGINNIKIYMVWIQGTVNSVTEDSDEITVILNDGSGSAKVTYVGNEVIKPWISTGVYCSAFGYIKKVAEVPEVHVVKMTNLSHNGVYEKIWPYEVKELKLILLDLIQPSLEPVESSEW